MQSDPETERVAKLIAFWHGQKIAYVKPGEGALTVAAVAGYGRFANAPEHYMEAHWEEYSSAAHVVIIDFAKRRRKSKAFRKHLRFIKKQVK